MRQPYLVHHAVGTSVDVAFRVVDEFQNEPVAHQIGRTHSDRPLQLQQLFGAVVGQFEFPPELEAEQTLVEAARPLAVGNAQSDVVESRSVTGHYNLP